MMISWGRRKKRNDFRYNLLLLWWWWWVSVISFYSWCSTLVITLYSSQRIFSVVRLVYWQRAIEHLVRQGCTGMDMIVIVIGIDSRTIGRGQRGRVDINSIWHAPTRYLNFSTTTIGELSQLRRYRPFHQLPIRLNGGSHPLPIFQSTPNCPDHHH